MVHVNSLGARFFERRQRVRRQVLLILKRAFSFTAKQRNHQEKPYLLDEEPAF